MGLFDIFRKKQETKVEEQRKQPLTLQYRDGSMVNVIFDGACQIDGKSLHSAQVIYISQDGSFETRSVLLEPITSQGTNGEIIDSTEQYYRWMATKDGTEESSKRYGAVKGFFQKEQTEDSKIGSNYIGNVAMKDDGTYYRHYDSEFKNKYTKTYKINKEQLISKKEAHNKEEEAKIRDYCTKMQDEGRKYQDIYEKIKQNVASQEEINEYYGAVHHKYNDEEKKQTR